MLTFDYSRFGIEAGQTMLDLGCGNGRHTYEALKRGASVVSLDLDPEPLAKVGAIVAAMQLQGEIPLSARWIGVVGDALHLPFEDRTFDRVVASEVLEHIVEDHEAMEEMSRVLRPGGRAVVSVPRWWPEVVCWALSPEYRTKPGGHVRIYRFGQLVERLHAAGLSLYENDHAHALHSPYWWLRCLFGVEDERSPLPRLYHGFLVWEMTSGGRPTRLLERTLDPFLGKSLVLYLEREGVRIDARTT
jgi:SAM-dependent methyltransferase